MWHVAGALMTRPVLTALLVPVALWSRQPRRRRDARFLLALLHGHNRALKQLVVDNC